MEVMQRKSAAEALEDKLKKTMSRHEAAVAQAAAASAVFAGLSLCLPIAPSFPSPLLLHMLIPARDIDVSARVWSL